MPYGEEASTFPDSQFEFAGASGFNVSGQLADHIGIQMPHFGMEQFDDFVPLQIAPTSSVDTLPASITFPNRPWSVRYEFELQNIELTNRRKTGPFDVTFGIRYVDFDKNLQFLAKPK